MLFEFLKHCIFMLVHGWIDSLVITLWNKPPKCILKNNIIRETKHLLGGPLIFSVPICLVTQLRCEQFLKVLLLCYRNIWRYLNLLYHPLVPHSFSFPEHRSSSLEYHVLLSFPLCHMAIDNDRNWSVLHYLCTCRDKKFVNYELNVNDDLNNFNL